MQHPDPFHPTYAHNEQYSVMEFCTRMWRKRARILLWGAGFLLATAFYLLAFTKPYIAEALVRVDAETNLTSGVSHGPDINLDSEMDFIRSRSMFLQALNQLGPAQDVAPARAGIWASLLYQTGVNRGHIFRAQQPGLIIDALQVPDKWLNQKLTLQSEPGNHFTLRDAQNHVLYNDQHPTPSDIYLHISQFTAAPGQRYTLIPRSPHNVPMELQHQLMTEAMGRSARSGLIRISFASDNADFAKRFLSALVETYIKRAYDISAQAKLQSIARLEAQLAATKTDLEKAELNLKNFQLRAGFIDLTEEMQSALKQLIDVETQIRGLKAKQKELSAYYTPAHPMQVSLTEQLRFLETEQQTEQRAIDQLPETQRQLLHFKREVETFKQTYAQTSEKLTQLRNDAATVTGYAKVIDEPEILPGSGLTNFMKNLILSFLAGCCVGSLVTYLITFSPLANLTSEEQLRNLTPLPVLGRLMRLSRFESLLRNHALRSNLPLIRSDNDATLFEDFLTLMKNLAFASFGAENPVTLVSSQQPSYAAAITSINIASLYARMHKTLLIDCSMREQGLHSYLSLRPTPGLSDVVIGQATLDTVLHPLHPNLTFLSSGTVTSNGAPLLHQPLFIAMLKEFAVQYRSILLYFPGLHDHEAESELVTYVGAVALVVSRGEKCERIRKFLAPFRGRPNVKGVILDNLQEMRG